MSKRAAISNWNDVDAGNRLLLALQIELNDATRGVRRTATPRSIHALRVTARRLRILLRALRDTADPTLYVRLRFELKQLARAAGPARDAHIRKQIAMPLLRSARSISAKDLRACSALFDRTARHTAGALLQTMRGAAWSSRLAHINEALTNPRLLAHRFEQPAERTMATLRVAFVRRLKQIDRALAHKLKAIRKLHRLRGKIKNARYLGEMQILPSATKRRAIVERLHKMQDALGDLHDTAQLRRWLRKALLLRSVKAQLSPQLEKLETMHFDRYRKQRKPLLRAIHEYLSAG